ncbi:hypothetical protein DY000_02045200 [Brassica cretica]|uniref:Rx N-terminal domain-containing protein n=1 Tax=Brassica cretica TaxID=69181 RepID=A0ABQ7EYJ4_BRACR|nr:hypothetical protein DY000_02045200 [Brassica cretica]
MEEMRASDRHVFQLAEKVENLTLYSDYETDQRLARVEKIVGDIGKEQSKFRQGFEYFVGPVPACVDKAQSLYPSKRSSLLR